MDPSCGKCLGGSCNGSPPWTDPECSEHGSARARAARIRKDPRRRRKVDRATWAGGQIRSGWIQGTGYDCEFEVLGPTQDLAKGKATWKIRVLEPNPGDDGVYWFDDDWPNRLVRKVEKKVVRKTPSRQELAGHTAACAMDGCVSIPLCRVEALAKDLEVRLGAVVAESEAGLRESLRKLGFL